jgi:hypothetical protein|tara:strand:+ start:279 stop:449 length:171 start_codon:yes stop_codon:yes gene_type:complete
MPGKWDGRSRPSTDKYRNNFDDIFKKDRRKEDKPRGAVPWDEPYERRKNKDDKKSR